MTQLYACGTYAIRINTLAYHVITLPCCYYILSFYCTIISGNLNKYINKRQRCRSVTDLQHTGVPPGADRPAAAAGDPYRSVRTQP